MMTIRKLKDYERTKLQSCIDRANDAIKGKNLEAAKQIYFEFEGLVRGIENFNIIPHTPGSSATAWYQSHWYKYNIPEGNNLFLSLRAIATAAEIWIDKEPHIFDKPRETAGQTYSVPPIFSTVFTYRSIFGLHADAIYRILV